MKTCLRSVILITTLLLMNISYNSAQVVQWAKQGSDQGFDNGNGIVADDSGNVYVTGQIEYCPVFDSYTLCSYGIHDILAAKYDTHGNIKWIHSAGGTGGDVGNGLGIDGAHNTYVAGEVETTANFGSGITLTSSGSNDVFLAKYDINGQILYAKRWGSSSNDKALAIAVAPNGDCFITGYFSGSTNFGGTTLSNSGSSDVFVMKTNSSGTVQWAKKAGGSREDRGQGIAVDRSGNIYVTGTFTQSESFGSTTITNTGRNSTFLAKYNSSGTLQWARASGACCDTTKAETVTTDENGNIYIAGHFAVSTKFGSTQFSSVGGYDVFVVKYDPSGNVLWAKRAGGNDEDIAYGVAVDTIRHVLYVTGSSQSSTGTFDTCSYSVVGFKDVFIAAYDMSGNALWVKTNGGHYRDVGSSIAVDPLGYIYTTGIFNGESTFDSITLHGYPNQPWADFYVDKVTAQPAIAPTTQSTNLTATQGHCSDLDFSFTPGNGNRRIIVVHEGSAVSANPVDGFIYSADPNFGDGDNLGNNNFVVYDGTGNSITVTGLTPGATYYFSVFEYNGVGASINYRTSSPPSTSAVSANFNINIAGLQNAICIGDSLNLQASGANTYSWLPLTGLSTGSGPNVIAKPNATIDYTVTATNISGCQAIRNFTVTVNPLPVVHFANLNAVCQNDPPVTLTTGTPAGGIYSGTGVSGGQFNPAIAGAGTFTLQYEYTDANGCSDVNPATVLVNSIPSVTMTPLPAVCSTGSPFQLNNGSPSGGVYSGVGVNAGRFNPAVGTGVYTINYSYTNNLGCTNTASVFQVVAALPNINLGNDIIVCASNSAVINAGSGFSTYNWSDGSTTSSITVDSNGTGLGSEIISVEVSNSTGCINSDTMQVTFDLCAKITDPHFDGTLVNIFPNPFTRELNLTTEKRITFSIYDVCGQLLEKRENVSGHISVGENLVPGIYFIEVISGQNKEVFPVLKSN